MRTRHPQQVLLRLPTLLVVDNKETKVESAHLHDRKPLHRVTDGRDVACFIAEHVRILSCMCDFSIRSTTKMQPANQLFCTFVFVATAFFVKGVSITKGFEFVNTINLLVVETVGRGIFGVTRQP